MSMNNRYFFYGLAFVIVILAIVTKSYALLVGALVAGVVLGFTTEYFDNKRDEKYKHYNAKHKLHH
ncbi:MAG TPA: hypothetical protein VFV52_10880 [Bacilli bacterium]|nr:hypothetical protein [Bacilli bacterium]